MIDGTILILKGVSCIRRLTPQRVLENFKVSVVYDPDRRGADKFQLDVHASPAMIAIVEFTVDMGTAIGS